MSTTAMPTKNIIDNRDFESDNEEETHWGVFDSQWDYDHKYNEINENWQTHADFDTLEEAMAEFTFRRYKYMDDKYEVNAVYLEEMGGDMESHTTLKYWEKISLDEYKLSNRPNPDDDGENPSR